MATDLPAGSQITVQIQFTPSAAAIPDPVTDVSNAVAELTQDGIFNSVAAPQTVVPNLFTQAEDFIESNPTPANTTLVLVCLTGNDTDDASDVISEAFSDVTGYTPSSVAITNISVPQATATGIQAAPAPGTSVATSQPGNATNPDPGSTTAGGSLSDAINSFFNSLESAGTTVLIGLVAIVVLVLVLAAYHPDAVKATAGAFA